MQNATPVFVDIEKETLIPSLESIKKKSPLEQKL